MSELLFPTLRGLTYPIQKIPHWKTLQNRTVSGVKKFVQLYTYPYYEFRLSFSYLGDTDSQSDDIHTLAGFYNKMGGAGVDFLYADPLVEPNSVKDQEFGITDGITNEWQLVRNYGGFVEPVFGILEAPVIYAREDSTGTIIPLVSGTHYTLTSTGLFILQLEGIVPFGYRLFWTGKWYYRCHFAEDEAELEQIFYGGWALEELTLESIKVE